LSKSNTLYNPSNINLAGRSSTLKLIVAHFSKHLRESSSVTRDRYEIPALFKPSTMPGDVVATARELKKGCDAKPYVEHQKTLKPLPIPELAETLKSCK
jgi:hypothetical protein